ncbi:hypothetical protein FJ987_25795 [Mesorhizobium sp. CU2]|uniref:hypothetical protein n=1 Tax=unclassified Mesorhizobium TaxID=325217 RepID=UPI00112E40AB|nr:MULTISPECIES: hypothetical protein [unclassified Mesorhizobium]TPN81050.1 hypothetical protein FJ988_19320 [Mesorhizobium sp. CU3]TPO05732.1 hypothetical protein FJ987_25795 [Mesorhizobium sp. CU2]
MKLREWRGRLADSLALVRTARAPFLVSAVSAASLAFPSQVYEIYRVLALDPPGQAAPTVFAVVALLGLAVGLSLLAMALTPSGSRFRAVLAAVTALVPIAGAAAGLILAGFNTTIIGAGQPAGALEGDFAELFASISELPSNLIAAGVILALIGSSVAVGFFRLGRSFRPAFGRVAAPICGIGAFGGIAFAIAPYRLPELLGSVAIVLCFFLIAAALFSILFRMRDRWNVPAFSLLLIVATCLAWLNISDNHIPPKVQRSAGAAEVQPTAAALYTWLSARGDREHFLKTGRPYPIFIISAAGGGHYAADFAATFLARVQDRCPNFSQHIFAISSVSGGSIGAGVFAALAKSFAANGPWSECAAGARAPGMFERTTRQILDRDFLAPVMASMLFGDVPQTFVPALVSRSDRAEVFDRELERAWSEVLPNAENPLASPFLDFWRADGAAPAVLANTTQVENGMRVVVAPFMSIDSPLQAGTLHHRARYTHYVNGYLVDEGWEALGPGEDIRFSTALGLSARFPWIMPAARFITSSTQFRLVDGGYLDNSGDETAFDLLLELRQIQEMGGKLAIGQSPPFEVHLITLTSNGVLVPGAVEGFGELLSPVRTLLSSRVTRADMATHRIRAFLNPQHRLAEGTIGDFTSPSPIVSLNAELPLPLTWQLASATQRLISAQVGDAASCRNATVTELATLRADTPPSQQQVIRGINKAVLTNSCVACSISYRLSGGVAPRGRPCAGPQAEVVGQ